MFISFTCDIVTSLRVCVCEHVSAGCQISAVYLDVAVTTKMDVMYGYLDFRKVGAVAFL